MAPTLRPEDIENQQFTVVRVEAGYRQTEVDEFLDAVHAAYVEMWQDNAQMQQKLSAAAASAGGLVSPANVPVSAPETVVLPKVLAAAVEEAPAPAPAPDNGPSLSSIALLLKNAEETAAKIIADAKAEAERVKGEAYSAGAQLKQDAEQAVAQQKFDASESLRKLRDDAEADIAKAKTEAQAFVDKLKADAGAEASTLVEAAKAEKAQLVAHVEALTSSKESILSVVKEVLAKVEGK
jgi:DivIVA domain-containing protein